MRILQVFNQYRSPFSGEEVVVDRTIEMLRADGHHVELWMRSSREIDSLPGKIAAFCSGIYSPAAGREMLGRLTSSRTDVVHVHNLYPLFSPSVLVACQKAGVPVVMTVHNQSLTCPRADHLYRDEICERCFGGREYNCALQNCRGNLFESVAYAARSMYARRSRLFHDNITTFIALSHFAAGRLAVAGYDENRITVLPNMVTGVDAPTDPARGKYAAFAGRISPEKGLLTLVEAARRLPHEIHIAGAGHLLESLEQDAPTNVRFRGRLNDELESFYRQARFLVLPSQCFEMCPLAVLEAMSHGLPVITTNLGGQAELVDDNETGLLFQASDAQDLADKMKRLWDDDSLCRRLGRAAFDTVHRQFSERAWYANLLHIYEDAIKSGRTPASARDRLTRVES